MNLVQMSVTGAVMILFAVIIRALLSRRLPKKTFLVLWWIVIARLLLPYSLPCVFSVYSLLTRKETAAKTVGNITVPFIPGISAEISSETPPDVLSAPSTALPVDIRTAVWLIGMLATAVFFTVSYIKCLRQFGESLPVENSFIKRWLADHRLCRTISVRYSDRISSPLTYGIFRPVILLPKNFEQIEPNDLKFVLGHEYTHIRRFDTVFKLMLIVVLCVHWFNPAVWLMYILANRDIELSCDEDVVRMFGSDESAAYAMALIRMEEIKSGLAPLTNNFGKNAIEKRITCIMKFKKISIPAIAAAVFLVMGTVTVFATTPVEMVQQTGEPNESVIVNNSTDNLTSGNTSSDVSTAVDPNVVPETPVETSTSEGNENVSTRPTSRYILGYGYTNDVLIVTHLPAKGCDLEPFMEIITAEKIITFDSYEDVLYPNNSDYSTYFKYNEDGTVTAYYYNKSSDPLDFTNAKPKKKIEYTHQEIINGIIMEW